jgi:hypothetical protein
LPVDGGGFDGFFPLKANLPRRTKGLIVKGGVFIGGGQCKPYRSRLGGAFAALTRLAVMAVCFSVNRVSKDRVPSPLSSFTQPCGDEF